MPMSEEDFLVLRIVAFVEPNVVSKSYSFDHLFETIRNWRGLGYRFELEQLEYIPGVIAEKFTDGVDEMWFFGTAPCRVPEETIYLSTEDSAVVQSLMDKGVGVFATGDHACIGSGLCERLPQRVANMRKWSGSGTPLQIGPSRYASLAWNPDCDDETESGATSCDDDDGVVYDGFPKPVWVSRRSAEVPHELMQLSGHYSSKRPIRFLPDHMHEGKLFDYARGPFDGELAALASAYASGPVPYIVARSVRSVFDNDSNPVDCASYPVVSAYEPSVHRPWGNIVVDSTFHHWVDKEVLAMGVRPARRHVEQLAINLANWLLGSRGRKKVRAHVHQFIAKINPAAGNLLAGVQGKMDDTEIKNLVDQVAALLTKHRFPADMLVPILDERVDSSNPALVEALVDTKFPELKGLDVYQLQSKGILQNLVLGLQFRQLREALPAE